MPTINGTKSGTRPYLQLDWSVNSQDITNNRSSVNLKLYLQVDYAIGYSARYTGTLQGASFTSSSGYISKPGRYLLTQRDVWIGHNSDGSKTASFTADYNLNITWGGTYFGKITLSGTGALGTIPRASTLSAFSFAANLKPSTEVTINYTVDRKSTAFRHQVQLRDGSHMIQQWDNQDSNGASTVKLSTASVNSLLSRMSSVTSRSLTLRVSTRSGVSGGWIGSAVTINATATIDATVKPTVSALTVSQTGNSVTTHYLQGKSKITGKFTRTAVGGATIASSSITVRRKTSNTDVQTINSNDGTTGKTVSLTGTYEAQGMTKDSRGRTTYTAWKEFTVTAYTSPMITTFTAVRNASTPTTVNITRAGTHSHLGGSNVLTYTVQRKLGTGAWTNVNTNPTGTSIVASFTGTSTSTGNAVTSSYDFRMVITDSFGEKAESVVSVSTQRVVLDIHKNEGVGIGKIHEHGVLDVDGEAHFKGDLYVNGVSSTRVTTFHEVIPMGTAEDSISFWTSLPKGTYFVHPDSIPNQPSRWGILDHMSRSGEFTTMWYSQPEGVVYRKSGNFTNNHSWLPMTIVDKSNTNGYWVEFPDGTLFAQGEANIPRQNDFTFYGFPIVPHATTGVQAGGVTIKGANWSHMQDLWKYDFAFYGNGIRFFKSSKDAWSTTGTMPITYWYIGRWKA